jgi:xylulokinase
MVLAVDVGTTALKAGLFDEAGLLAARAEVPVHLSDREEPLRHEADANNWIGALALAAAQLQLARSPPEAVVVSGNGPTLVPVGGDGRPLDFAMTWLDRRGVEEARLAAEATGRYVDPSFYLPKALWLFRHKPRLYRDTRHFLSCPEFVDFYLTGEACTVLPSEPFQPYMWTPQALERLGMDPGKFPPFVRPGADIGRVRAQAEEVLGIPAGTPVFAGGPDFIMTLLGTATTSPGRTCDRAGTSEGVNLCTRAPVADRRLLCLPHIIEGFWNVSGIISTSGKALDWFKNAVGGQAGGAVADYDGLFEEVCQVPPGARGLLFLPYLAGERTPLWDPYARGCFIGLTASHGRPEMARAVVESVGFAIRDAIEVMAESGLAVGEMRVTGGQARSPLWNQIRADITGRRILVPEILDSELLGCGIVGLFALGRHRSLEVAAEALVRIRRVHEPRPALAEPYGELFRLYRQSYRGLKDVFASLSRVQFEEES